MPAIESFVGSDVSDEEDTDINHVHTVNKGLGGERETERERDSLCPWTLMAIQPAVAYDSEEASVMERERERFTTSIGPARRRKFTASIQPAKAYEDESVIMSGPH